MDEENFAISLDKCKFACKQIKRLGFHLDSEGTTPLSKKTDAIEKLSPPKTFKQFKSFMGSIHHLTRYIPHSAQAAAALRPLLKNTDKHKTFNWSAEHESAFQKIKKLVTENNQNNHFDQNLDTLVVWDASTFGLGATLEQYTKEWWVAIAYASRFLNSLEQKYSVNELELLGVVWAIEHFKYYLNGKKFTVITDHQTLISAFNASKQSKTSQSKLTKWIDQLISFNFDIKYLPWSEMGLIDYIAGNPVGIVYR